MSIIDPTSDDEAKTYAESYRNFASTLRTWLVAYGIGAPVLFASQAAFSKVLTEKNQFIFIMVLYLIGVSIQILSTFMYKASMWYVMWGAMNEEFKTTARYGFSDWVSEQLWLELLLDLASIACFAAATLLVIVLFAQT